jgi:chorismate mutase
VSERFDEIRTRILANDERIVAAVNERLELVRELWRLKVELGAERVDRERERALRAALAETNAGPLSPAGLDRLVTALLDLTKQELAPAPRERDEP